MAIVGFAMMKSTTIPKSYVKVAGQVIQNTVTQNEERINSQDTVVYTSCAEVQFTPTGGQPITFRSSTCKDGQAGYTKGEPVTVAYNPSNPSSNPKLATSTANNLRYSSIGILAVGAIFILVGIFRFMKPSA